MSSNVSSVFWQLWVNNNEITGHARACINSIEFDNLCDGSDTCTLNITDPDFIFIEDNIFIDEAKVLARFGFNEDIDRTEFSGYISAIDISFPEEGSPTLTVTCLDNSHLMNREKKNRSWDNVTRADVVKKIAAEYGYYPDIESCYDFAVQETISQSDQTDIEFLENLATEEREPFMCKVVGTTIIYKKKGLLQSPVADIGYKTYPFDVKSFSPQINKETHKEEVTSANVNTSDKTNESYTATDSNVSRDVQGESIKTTDSSSLNDKINDTSNMVYDPEKREWIKK